jgi:hypothetical protein
MSMVAMEDYSSTQVDTRAIALVITGRLGAAVPRAGKCGEGNSMSRLATADSTRKRESAHHQQC